MTTEATRTKNTERDRTVPCRFRVGSVPRAFRVRHGFTLIEMIATIAVLGIIVALSVTSFINFNKREALEQETGKIVALLSEARAQTMSAKGGSDYGVHFEAQKAVLFKGSVYNVGADTNRVQMLNSAVKISSIAFAQGGSDVVFKKLTGGSTKSGTITIVSVRDSTDTKTVTIATTGIAYSN